MARYSKVSAIARKGLKYFYGAMRRNKLRTPPWANMEAIKAIYILAAEITDKTGIHHQVDHVIPLRGVLAHGLHVAENLAVIPKIENVRKSNRFVPF